MSAAGRARSCPAAAARRLWSRASLRRHPRGGADRGAARARPGSSSASAWRGRRCSRPAARPGPAPTSSRVMGLAEVLAHLPRLLRLRAQAARAVSPARGPTCSSASTPRSSTSASPARLQARRHPHRAVREPAGVGLAPGAGAHHRPRLRPGAVPAAVRDRVLRAPRACAAEFVGHPLADQIPLERRSRRRRARRSGSQPARPLIALLPGSRLGEVARLGAAVPRAPPRWLAARRPAVEFIAPMASARHA